MRVKRYVVDSMPDALQKIRSELGKDAVIINTKEIKIGGFLGLFTKKKIEVIAANDAAPSPSKLQPAVASSAAASISNASGRAAYQAQTQTGGLQAPNAELIQAPETRSPQASAQQALQAAIRAAQADHAKARSSTALLDEEERLLLADNPTTGKSGGSTASSPRREDQLLEELKQMKEMMLRISKQTAGENVLPEPFEAVKQRLLNHDILPPLAARMIEQAIAGVEEPFQLETADAARLVKEQLLALASGRTKNGISPNSRVIHFVGPTGVGKTTTIAKLAAEQVLKHQRKVGFITSDTYRIAAVEQLKTYANILNVPLEVVFSPQDLAKAFHNLKDCDMIFMDTAGRNFRNELYVSELNSLLQAAGSSETFLVLSMTAKYKDMKVIAENFSKFKLDKVLFTKADETDSFGAIFNLLEDFPFQLSYITYGQNVPDDIGLLQAERYIDAIVEEDRNE
ncbi:flagellar biosynthesis protein FlhF [Paenibacillus turpanensis]|uniref:flagellar biosynthesis protein FlhF n=1 Tax=Paenibacillus turpanensis TaxID=2689078 RepID=UPI00140A51AB|nr:flagellar biosynthesis protein FlhF [Paenibacillus turpanensis]